MLPRESVADVLVTDLDDQDVSPLLNAGADAGAGDAGAGGSSGSGGDGEAAAGHGLARGVVPPTNRHGPLVASAADPFNLLTAADVREEMREELKVFAAGSLRAELKELSADLRRDVRRILDEMLPRDVIANLGKQLLMPPLLPSADNRSGNSRPGSGAGSLYASQGDASQVATDSHKLPADVIENFPLSKSYAGVGEAWSPRWSENATTDTGVLPGGAVKHLQPRDLMGPVGVGAAVGSARSSGASAAGYAVDSELGLNSKLKLELQALLQETLGSIQQAQAPVAPPPPRHMRASLAAMQVQAPSTPSPRLMRGSSESFHGRDMTGGGSREGSGKKRILKGPMRTWIAAEAFEEYDVEGDYSVNHSKRTSRSSQMSRSSVAFNTSRPGHAASKLNYFFKRTRSESKVHTQESAKVGASFQVVPAVGDPSLPDLKQPMPAVVEAEKHLQTFMSVESSLASTEVPRLKVTVGGARNLQHSGGNVETCCTCRVKSKSDSEWKTRPVRDASNPRWDACNMMRHWEPGDSLEFIIGDCNALDPGSFMGRAYVPSSKFEKFGFEGELPLRDPNGDVIKFGVLQIKLELVHLSSLTKLDEEEEDEYELLPRALTEASAPHSNAKSTIRWASDVHDNGLADLSASQPVKRPISEANVMQSQSSIMNSSVALKDRHNRKQVFIGRSVSSPNRSVISRNADKVSENLSYKIRSTAIATVGSTKFDIFTGLLILMNALWIGIQTHILAEREDALPPSYFAIVDSLFAIAFAAELALRIYCYRIDFFFMRGNLWNILDFLLVMLNLIEEIVSRAIDTGTTTNFSFMRALRILRLIRVVRLVRIVRLIGELRTIVCSIVGSLKSLVWTILLLTLLIYVVGIYFTQLVADHGRGHEDLKRYFGSLARTILTLFEAFTGGIDWDSLAYPLAQEIHPLCALLFAVYIAFNVLAMMNVVTGVFVESALMTARHDKDVDLVNQLREVFVMSDTDCTGMISREEFETHINEPAMCAVFKAIDLDISEAQGLFELIDVEDTSEISREEFIMGCLRLKGHAKALDLATLMYDHKRVANMLEDHMQWVESYLSRLF